MEGDQSAKEEIKRTVDIAELVGQYVQLKKAGQNYLGLCPFHSEKTPSFTVSSPKQMFHCFGCKKGGDIFTFWMEYHKVPFPQALKDLADRFHITLTDKDFPPQSKGKMELKESLFKINEAASRYFHNTLLKSKKGQPGKEYLEKRSVPQEIISEFMIGYAPDGWDGLTGFLKTQGMEMEKAVQAGLIVPKKNGEHYDRFRGRIIFPLFNQGKQVVGFGGRVLDDSLPKYLNTPETPVFRKGEFLYGLHVAFKPIRETGFVVVVEGYTDLLALKKHGVHNAVATLGTAFTREHIRKIKGYAQEAIVVFDSDEAGQAAALKSLSLFLNEGVSSKVTILPEGDDPDSFIHRSGRTGFLGLLKRAVPMFDYFLDRKMSQGDEGIEGQINVLKEILPLLSELRNGAQQSMYLQRLAEKLGIAESIVRKELQNWQAGRSRNRDEKSVGKRLASSIPMITDDVPLLNLLVHYPHSVKRLLNPDCRILFKEPAVVEIFDIMVEFCKKEGEITSAEILEKLKGESARERFRETMIMPPICRDHEVELAVSQFEDKVHKIEMSASFKKAVERGDPESINKISKLKRERWG